LSLFSFQGTLDLAVSAARRGECLSCGDKNYLIMLRRSCQQLFVFLMSASDPAGQADLAATDINLPRTPSFVNTFFGFYLSPH
ncbi:hypothetical protein ACFQ5F_09720, partial [Kroppenstedtia eburnea]|uniref:hypothetical protein n=1 Tax=Kroppenstedtia eburnea TaxID=714067 RepID=UPI003643B021